MELKEYQEKAKRTMAELGRYDMNVMHMLMGLTTEIGELTDLFKKHYAYGRALDIHSVGEELADTMWYICNLCTLMNINLNHELAKNIAKLKIRYPEKFTEEDALNRDLEAERKVLES